MRITTTIAVVMMSLGLSAQGTTDEEYRYMCGGYSETVRMGLDVKNGYTVLDHRGEVTVEDFAITYKALYRTGDERPCGIIMVVRDSKQRLHYVGIPRLESDPKYFNGASEQVRTILNINAPNADVQVPATALFAGLVYLAQP